MPVVGNVSRLMTRNLYLIIQSRKSWDSLLNIKDKQKAIDEIFFWKNSVDNLNKRFMLENSMTKVLTYSDASNSAAGAYVVNVKDAVFQAFWSDEESKKSSTYREIKAVLFALENFKQEFMCKKVKWFTDSQNYVTIINTGSFNTELQELAFQIYQICVHNSILLNIQWISRNKNVLADGISKSLDYDDWGVS